MAAPNLHLHGIIPPMITPLSGRDTLDVPGLERLIEHILAGGVHGIFLLGTTGEGPSLSQHLRREMIQRACRFIDQRVPVLVGIADCAAVESLKVAQFAAENGADAVVLAAPYYFPIGQSELLAHVRRIVPELPLPVVLYNMPSHTKVMFEIQTVREAMNIPRIIGLKDSSGNMTYFHGLVQLAAQRPDFSLFVGPEQLLAESLMLGGAGGVCGGANLRPRLYVDLYEASRARDWNRVAELHRGIVDFATRFYSIGGPNFGVPNTIKCALHQLGICHDAVAEPFAPLDQAGQLAVRDCLTNFGITMKG